MCRRSGVRSPQTASSEALKKLFEDAWGCRLEYILRSALLLLLEQPQATLSDVVRLFHEKEVPQGGG